MARSGSHADRPTDPSSAAVRAAALALNGGDRGFDPLLARIGDAPVVLLGEASHGTQEFYALRAALTRRLIEEKGFTAVAVEADWPDAHRVDRYVRGQSNDDDARDALGDFERFPTWMWRNTEVEAFVEWLHAHNEARRGREVGFHGLDLYSLHRSVEAVLGYLDTADPDAARRARERYACFDHHGEDPQAYGYAASLGLSESCEQGALEQLRELGRRTAAVGDRDDGLFVAEQNARLVANAESYYRSMFRGRNESWNLRDTHMMQTLQALMRRPGRGGRPAKTVVWAHNSHLGDARATEMGARGELNLGQLVREHYRERAVLVGFSTYHGSVTAASNWDEPAQRKRVRPGLPGSYEALFHDVGLPAFQLRLHDAPADLALPRLQRAIGVIYRPETERMSHYFHTVLPQQFDWMIHVDETHALTPLEPGHRWGVPAGATPDAPETYPSGL